MLGKIRVSHWLIVAAILVLSEGAAVLALTVTAQAQWRDDRYPFLTRQRPQSGGFFDGFFGPSNRQYYQQYYQVEPVPPPQRADDSRAPSPRKPEAGVEAVVPTTTIVVMGDGMADWLAYGLEDAFSDSPEVAIVRKNKAHSGLLRYEGKGDLDWWHVARDLLAQEKPSYVVMMLGVTDRQNIREKDLPQENDPKAKTPGDKAATEQTVTNQNVPDKDKTDDSEQQPLIAPEPSRTKMANGVIEFRSDRWAEIYAKRIDDTIAALKSKGVPVFWVGLPPLRGPKSTADTGYLNDLYRARAERAGAVYIDVWDGFVDENGKFASYGPDYEGQMRRLRSNDGVYFTKSGARKLAHYVEHEIRRYMSNRALPVALPTGPVGPMPENKSAVRPVAGPVMPLTATPANAEELLGASASQPLHSDVTADHVLVKGEPLGGPAGRADDFAWPQGDESKLVPPVATAPTQDLPAAPEPAANAVAHTEPPASAAKAPEKPKRGVATTSAQATQANIHSLRPPHGAPRTPAPVRRSSDPLGWWR
jgi:hypothetical protein